MLKTTFLFRLILFVVFFNSAAMADTDCEKHKYYLPKAIGNKATFNEVLSDDTPIDYLILGSSISWVGINTEILSKGARNKTQEKLVWNVSSNWRGDNLYFDLLTKILDCREVRNLIFNPPFGSQENGTPHPLSIYFQPINPEFSFFTHFQEIFSYVSIELLRKISQLQSWYLSQNIKEKDQILKTKGYLPVSQWLDKIEFKEINFVDTEELNNTQINKHQIKYTNNPVNHHDATFLKKIVQLSDERGTRLFFVFLPEIDDKSEQYNVSVTYKDFIENKGVEFIGSKANELEAITNMPATQLYYDNRHLNINGAKAFTAIITNQILNSKRKNTHGK